MITRPSTTRVAVDTPRIVAGLLLMLAAAYLVPFVDRGWVPIDEGMTGQAAERVLTGALPHVDYEEPYPGALSYFYAAVFRMTGIDLVHLRWTVFAGALVTMTFVHVILRRHLRPVCAAIGTLVALGWSFPNYFSSLPSWWLLLCALVCLWGLIRHVETERLLFVGIAGLAAGVAFTIKQTGIYLLPPLMMSLMASPSSIGAVSASRRRADVWIRAAIGTGVFVLVVLIMRTGIGSGEVLYLLVPVAAACLMFALLHRWTDAPGGLNWRSPLVAAAAAAVPVVILLWPHIAAGTVSSWVNGVFVIPQRRLHVTTLPMRPASHIVAAVAAILWLFWSAPSLKPGELRIVKGVRWSLALALPFLALYWHFAYTFIWEAIRGTAAMLPVIAFWLAISGRIQPGRDRRILFAASAMLAFASLGQFPFAAPVYFLYVAPLALIAGVVAFRTMQAPARLSDGPAIALALLFAVVCMNREYVWNVGSFHRAYDLTTPLALPRASLNVVDFEADAYRWVMPLVRQRLGEGGRLMAGPDTPEVYFLAGRVSPSGRLFDFFSAQESVNEEQEFARWASADVIVLFYGKRFSAPVPDTLVSRLRKEFPHGEFMPPFEVRWR